MTHFSQSRTHRISELCSILLLGFALVFSQLLLTGCQPPAELSETNIYPFRSMIFDASAISNTSQELDNNYIVSNEVSDQCNVSLYLDATKSMQGFISLNKPGNYEKVLQGLEETSFLAFKNNSFNYYQFWEKPQAIEREQFRIEAFTQEFYDMSNAESGNDATQTSLINVFQAIGDNSTSPKKDMAIVVSDLVSTSKSDRSDVAKYLNERFLRQGYAIAILGIQAEFSGKVYDVVADGENYTFDYMGNRPYYLILIGDIANLRAYISQFEAGISSQLAEGEYQKVLIFNQALSSTEALSLGSMTIDENYKPFVNTASKDNLVSANAINQTAASQAEYVQLFYDLVIEKPEMSTPGLSITWPNKYQIDPDSVLKLSGWNYTTDAAEVQGYEINQDTGEAYDIDKSAGKSAVDSKPSNIQLLSTSYDSKTNLITLPITLNMQKMEKDQSYLLRVNLYGQPSFTAKEPPGWLSSWSTDFSSLDKWLAEESTYQGNTTPYLNDLVSTLWQKCASEAISCPAIQFGSYYLGFISCKLADQVLQDACMDQIDLLKQQ